MPRHFQDRLTSGKSSPCLLIVSQCAQIAEVVEALVLLWSVAEADELRDQAFHIPSLMRHSFAR